MSPEAWTLVVLLAVDAVLLAVLLGFVWYLARRDR